MVNKAKVYGDKIDIAAQVDHQYSLATLLQEIGQVQLIGSAYTIEDAELLEADKTGVSGG